MLFEYDHDKIKTTDEITISVADLRDLIQVGNIQDEQQALAECRIILAGILRKNRLETLVLKVETESQQVKVNRYIP